MKKLALVILLITNSAVAADLDKGKQSYTGRCASCHGISGLADGPVAQSMGPGVITNLKSGPFKFATDLEKTKELIKKGGAAFKLNAMMPPAASIEDEELNNLAEYVISLRK
jgi:mono/diheme cytochrome c family protein